MGGDLLDEIILIGVNLFKYFSNSTFLKISLFYVGIILEIFLEEVRKVGKQSPSPQREF